MYHHRLNTKKTGDPTQHALRQFFSELYQALYDHPESFGFKLQPDDYLIENEEGEKEHKQSLARKMKKSQKVIKATLDFLMHLGVNGTLEGDVLSMPKDDIAETAFRSRNQKQFFARMAELGMHITADDDRVAFHCEHTPEMMAALQALAKACAEHKERRAGLCNFWRCDFNAIETPDYIPPVEELYTLFRQEDQVRLLELHAYFTEHGYRPSAEIYEATMIIKYQGDRKVKSTPLYQLDWDDRYQNPLRVEVKSASTVRLKDLIPLQSEVLQADFSKRVYPCQGDKCGWCYDKKALGPSKVSFNGETRVVCWYSYPMIYPFTDESVPLIKEYEQMHAQLVES